MKRAVALVLFSALLVIVWLSSSSPNDVPTSEDTSPVLEQRAPTPAQRTASSTSRTGTPTDVAADAADETNVPLCIPAATIACEAGKLWSFDSCGAPDHLLDDCGGRGCLAEKCLAPPVGPACESAAVSALGRCNGSQLEYCLDGVAVRSDCADRGAHCAVGVDGEAECRPGLVSACAGLPPSGVCRLNVAIRCIDDQPSVRDCSIGGGKCDSGRCVYTRQTVNVSDTQKRCAVCGECNDDGPRGEEVCDGFDNDRNDMVDENVTCAPIPIRAFVIADGSGRLSETTERINKDIALANEIFASAKLGFVLTETVTLHKPEWLDATEVMLNQGDPAFIGTSFAIPIVFTQRMTLNEREKSGVASLPNGTCADLSFPHPRTNGTGSIWVAAGRFETTVAHELGHYLGLCHTHQLSPSRDVFRGDTISCIGCTASGDGICDTPTDPGPDACRLDACQPQCAERPDTANVMSYYVQCRRAFTAEQGLHLRRYAMRRQLWHGCLLHPEECPCITDAECGEGTQLRCETNHCVPEGSGDFGELCARDTDCRAGRSCVAAGRDRFCSP